MNRSGKAVLTNTRNLCFKAEIAKIMFIPVNPSFTFWECGLRGTNSSKKCLCFTYGRCHFSTLICYHNAALTHLSKQLWFLVDIAWHLFPLSWINLMIMGPFGWFWYCLFRQYFLWVVVFIGLFHVHVSTYVYVILWIYVGAAVRINKLFYPFAGNNTE